MGGRELEPSQIRTFVSVDFYNHDSKSGDQCETWEPIYNTLFSFKNVVDDFYIQHLEKECIIVDVFGVPPPTTDDRHAIGVIKIGTARLPLARLIDGDHSFQISEIIHHNEQGEFAIGKLSYKMRMR